MSALQIFKQEKNETIDQYYQRTKLLLMTIEEKDWKDSNETFFALKQFFFDMIIDQIISELKNQKLNIRMMKYTASKNKSLLNVNKMTQVEVRQIKIEKNKLDQINNQKRLQLLKSLQITLLLNQKNSQVKLVQVLLFQLQQITKQD